MPRDRALIQRVETLGGAKRGLQQRRQKVSAKADQRVGRSRRSKGLRGPPVPAAKHRAEEPSAEPGEGAAQEGAACRRATPD